MRCPMRLQTLKLALAVSALGFLATACSDSTPTQKPTTAPQQAEQQPTPTASSSKGNTRNPTADMLAATKGDCAKYGGQWDGQRCQYAAAGAGGGQSGYATPAAQKVDYSQYVNYGAAIGSTASQIKLPSCPNSSTGGATSTCPNK